MAGGLRRLGRTLAAVAPWALASAIVTVTLSQPLAVRVLPIQTLEPPRPPRPVEPKTPVVTFEPWEQVPS